MKNDRKNRYKNAFVLQIFCGGGDDGVNHRGFHHSRVDRSSDDEDGPNRLVKKSGRDPDESIVGECLICDLSK